MIDHDLLYAACSSEKCVFEIKLVRDGCGIRCEAELVHMYLDEWKNILSMTAYQSSLYIAHNAGIEETSLTTYQFKRIISHGPYYSSPSPKITAYKEGILFCDPASHLIRVWNESSGDLGAFAGSGEAGNTDGLSNQCKFFQPVGLAAEFNHVVYVCDAQTSCIKIFTTLAKTAQFLNAVVQIYKAFSVHEKHHSYSKQDLTCAGVMLGECLDHLKENENVIRSDLQLTGKNLNGPQGNVAAKTIESVKMLKDGVEQLKDTLARHSYKHANLLSCMTMDIKNMHSIVHHKSPLCTALEYARNFGNAVKEGLKRTTSWAAHYYTNPKSWYPLPERSIPYSSVLVSKPDKAETLNSQDISTMREWAHTYGAAVRQRTVRQETTMAKAGTLPAYLYQQEVQPGERIAFLDGVEEPEQEEIEYDPPTSEDEQYDEVENNEHSNDDDNIDSREADFLLGTRTRFGRAIRFNNRFIE